MSAWTLNTIPLDDLNLDLARGRIVSQDISHIQFTTRDPDYIALGEIFPFEAPGTLAKDGVPFFRGHFIDPSAIATPQTEGRSIILADPWYWLENLVFQQTRRTFDPAANGGAGALVDEPFPLILVGKHAGFLQLSIAQMIELVIDYAIARGAPMQKGVILATPTPDTPHIPPYELRAVTCAEIIRDQLRYYGDAVTYFDHSTTPATLHIKPRALLTAAVLTAHNADIDELRLTPLYKRQIPGVYITYRKTHQSDGSTYVTYEKDKAGVPGFVGNELRAVVETIDLAGSSSSAQTQDIYTRTYPTGDDPDDGELTREQWWKAHIPSLRNIDPGDLEILAANHTVELAEPDDASADTDPGDPEPPGALDPPDAPSDVPRELLDGTIQPWMMPGVRFWPCIFKATIRYTGAPTAETQQIFGSGGVILRSLRLPCTNALTKTYRTTTAVTQEEPAPTGLAQAIYDGYKTLEHTGSIRLIKDEIDLLVAPGARVNINGSRSEYATMNALVQSLDFDVDSGQMTIEIGPPSHLDAQDLIAILRAQRAKLTSFSENEKETGSPSGGGGGSSTGPLHSALQVLDSPGGGGGAPEVWYPTCAEVTPGSGVFRIIRIEPGVVDAITPEHLVTPIDTDPLNIPLNAGENHFYLVWNWVPIAEEFLDIALNIKYRLGSGGQIADGEVFLERQLDPVNVCPEVDLDTGALTEGTVYYPVFTITVADGECTVTAHPLRKSISVGFCSPCTFFVV